MKLSDILAQGRLDIAGLVVLTVKLARGLSNFHDESLCLKNLDKSKIILRLSTPQQVMLLILLLPFENKNTCIPAILVFINN